MSTISQSQHDYIIVEIKRLAEIITNVDNIEVPKGGNETTAFIIDMLGSILLNQLTPSEMLDILEGGDLFKVLHEYYIKFFKILETC